MFSDEARLMVCVLLLLLLAANSGCNPECETIDFAAVRPPMSYMAKAYEPPAVADDPEPAKQVRRILMFSRPNCSWCEKWKKKVRPIFETEVMQKSGVKVAIGQDNEAKVPWYEVEWDGVKFTHQGYMSIEDFRAKLTEAKNGQ